MLLETIFLYDCLRLPDVLEEVIGRRDNGSPNRLMGYKMKDTVIYGEDLPMLIHDNKSSVEGIAIYVTKSELEAIDRFEEEAYKRARGVLQDGSYAWFYHLKQP